MPCHKHRVIDQDHEIEQPKEVPSRPEARPQTMTKAPTLQLSTLWRHPASVVVLPSESKFLLEVAPKWRRRWRRAAEGASLRSEERLLHHQALILLEVAARAPLRRVLGSIQHPNHHSIRPSWPHGPRSVKPGNCTNYWRMMRTIWRAHPTSGSNPRTMSCRRPRSWL